MKHFLPWLTTDSDRIVPIPTRPAGRHCPSPVSCIIGPGAKPNVLVPRLSLCLCRYNPIPWSCTTGPAASPALRPAFGWSASSRP